MNQRQKHTIIAALLALLGVILIMIVILTLTKEHRFSRYENKKYGFTMGYPASWELREDVEGAAVIFLSPQENDLDFFKESVNVVVQDLTGNPMQLQPYTELAIDQMKLVFGDNFIVLESGPVTIAGEPGYKIVFLGKSPETEFKYMSTWMIKDNAAYQVTYTALSSQYDRYELDMKRMLRSFRFQ